MKYRPYPKYKPSGIEWLGEVPEHWDLVRLARLAISRCDGPFGSGLKSEHYRDEGVRVIRLQNIRLASFDDSDRAFIDEDYYEELGNHDVQPSDLLVAGLGDENNPVGRACVAPDGLGRAMVKADCFRFRLKNKALNPFFAAFQLTSTAQSLAGALATGTTRSRMNLSATSVRTVALPPVTEQQTIVKFLNVEVGQLDVLVNKKRSLIEKLKEKRQAVISTTVTRGLPPDAALAAGLNPCPNFKPSGVEWIGEIPAHWQVAQLRRFTRFVTSGSRGWAQYYADQGSVFVRIGNLTRDSIRVDLSDVQYVDPPTGAEGERTRIRAGDLLFSITAYLGSVAVAPTNVAGGYINQHIALVRLLTHQLIPEFAAFALLADVGQVQLNEQGYGGTKIQLGLDDIKSLWLPVPPVPEQSAIVDYLERERAQADALLRKTEAAIERLLEYRSALITAAVTGKIDVREANGSQKGNHSG